MKTYYVEQVPVDDEGNYIEDGTVKWIVTWRMDYAQTEFGSQSKHWVHLNDEAYCTCWEDEDIFTSRSEAEACKAAKN